MASHAKVKCKMDFAFYPFDTQNCKFHMSAATATGFLVLHECLKIIPDCYTYTG